MENKKQISIDKLMWIILISSLSLAFIGVFWILIAEQDLVGYIALGLSLIGFIYLVIGQKNEIIKFIREIGWKKLSVKFYYILIVIALIVVVNIIANKRFLRKDFTASKQYTLSKLSLNLLKTLDEDNNSIKMILFRSPGVLVEPVEELLMEYKSRCSVIKIEFINPDREPVRAKDYNIKSLGSPYDPNQYYYGTLIILSSGNRESVDVLKMDYRQTGGQYQPSLELKENLEKEISSALLQMTKEKSKIYFLQGRGEVNLDDQQQTGWFQTKKVISDENYMVDKLFWSSLSAIPKDCDILIIGAPEKSYHPKEYQVIDNYLNDGGRALVLLEPLNKININQFLANWGVKTYSKFVIDPTRCVSTIIFPRPTIPLITEYYPHPITRDLDYQTFFPMVAPVKILDELPDGVTVDGLAKTSKNSWIENDVYAKEVMFNRGVEKRGEVNIIAAISKTLDENKQARMVVIGDSDFACNAYVNQDGNMDLLMNSLNWLSGKEELIGIRSKPIDRREMQLTIQSTRFVFFFCVIILPLLVIIAGVVVWLKRR